MTNKTRTKGSTSLEIAFYSFFLLAIILSSLKINKELHQLRLGKIKGYFNEYKKK